MQALFLAILKMSATTSVVILVVLLARLVLTHAPKKYSYFLWAVVGFRMCCPIGFKSEFSLFRLLMPRTSYLEAPKPQATVVGEYPAYSLPASQAGGAATVPIMPPASPPPVDAASASAVHATAGVDWLSICALVWAIGAVTLLTYSIVQEIRLRRSLATATRLRGNIYQSEYVASPFLMGILRPKIYLPYHLPFRVQSYVIAHERYHMHRLDHIARRGAFLLLTLHWFNPLCWLGFYLMGKDMELSCDEGVLSNMRISGQEYSTTLLAFATNHRFLAVSPLAFGETSVKSRILNALKWKKPHPCRVLAGVVLSCGVMAVCVTDPLAADDQRILAMQQDLWVEQPLDCAYIELVAQNDHRQELSFYNENGDLVQWLNTYPEEDDTCLVLEGTRYLWDDAHNCLDSVNLSAKDFLPKYNYVEQACPQRLEEYEADAEQLVRSYQFEYDDQNRLIHKMGLDANNVLCEEWQYYYEANGLHDTQSYCAYNEEGQVQYWEDVIFEYTADGKRAHQWSYFEDKVLECTWEYYLQDDKELRIQESEWNDGRLTRQVDKDEEGRIFWAMEYDENEVLSRRLENEYNSKKQLVRQTESNRDGTIESISIYEYGTDQRLSKITKYISDNYLEIREYQSFPGWSVPVREVYYENGAPFYEVQRECYEDGKPKRTVKLEYGVIVEECRYNRQGEEIKRWQWDKQGRKILNAKSDAELEDLQQERAPLEAIAESQNTQNPFANR